MVVFVLIAALRYSLSASVSEPVIEETLSMVTGKGLRKTHSLMSSFSPSLSQDNLEKDPAHIWCLPKSSVLGI